MGKSLAEMEQNYGASQQFAEANWNAAKERMVQDWIEGMTETLGQAPSPRLVEKYRTKIANARYKTGSPQKFIRNYQRAMTQ